ncbi:hypothetical protein ADH76_00875 [Enterocloster clostridioformis]|nr:hypothetical protein A4V08_03520 [Lachnoclostridium sp. YL32]OXE70056.1 hypothetical protein ADH76_00875 [Enterocloster clostridioformis]
MNQNYKMILNVQKVNIKNIAIILKYEEYFGYIPVHNRVFDADKSVVSDRSDPSFDCFKSS